MLKPSLQLKLGQQLTMTPQLQQAIRLLQLSTLDLRDEIQQALDSNPMLESVEDGASEDGETMASDGTEFTSAPPDSMTASVAEREDTHDSAMDLRDAVADLDMGVGDDLPVDSVWEDVYESAVVPRGQGTELEGGDFEFQAGSSESLREHLLWQMSMTPFSARDQAIAVAIIDAVNDRGYLVVSLEEIQEGLNAELGDVELDEVLAVLHQVQNFDPVGVAARDLRECMLIQLQHLDSGIPLLGKARELVAEHLDLLANREYTQLARRLKCTQQELPQIIALVQSVNPRPGNLITDRKVEYIIPDVIVTREKNSWKVELNPEAMPRVRINASYASLVKRADNSNDNTYMRNQLQEARWFVKSLQSRNETLLKVASCIVERQRGFLEHGEEAMKALVLHDIAETVEMHESTISRVTTQKYMYTPRGIFELKYFFSSHVSTASGGECSATAIRALIKKLVAAEDGGKPLSDSKIAQLLKQQGINVARRTIAKYRESLAIPSSSERKRLI